MAEDVERVGIVGVARREELDPLAVGERRAQVLRRAVDLDEHGLLGELRPDRARGVEAGRAVGKLELRAIGKNDLHVHLQAEDGDESSTASPVRRRRVRLSSRAGARGELTERSPGSTACMTEPKETHPREDDRNEEIDESPAPDPTEKEPPAEDDPGAD